MKLRSPIVYTGLSLAVLLGTYAVGCGSDETEQTPTDQTGAQPPAEPEGAASGDGPGYVFAVNKLYLGDTDWNGTPSPSAWKSFGYNMDMKVSTKESTDLCQPAAGAAPSKVYPDGNDGIDNSFGKNILPIITGLAPDASTEVNAAIDEGTFTLLIKVDDLGDGSDYSASLLAKLYAGGDLGNAPAWDGNDQWPVLPELLNDPTDVESSKVQFPSSYVNAGTWVSGDKGELSLTIGIQGYELTLTISEAVITMDLASPRSGGSTQGLIAGVIETEPLIEELRKIAGNFDTGLCEGSTFDSIADQLRQASDIMANGSQDPGQTCNGISVGLGFDTKIVQLGGIATAAEQAPDPCLCGNETLDANETCDGDLLDGQGCTSVPGGFTGGTLACADDCREFDTDGCEGGGTGGSGTGG
ncbi:MAG: hypothetical protein JRI23_22970, partial [Deltaproteobacteria bacterium]|nr:hypothetical protein [Deltaproteobacteria bacterium]MBW2534834.1 hypothetical protein [Deltaproteobacteria bacterium]